MLTQSLPAVLVLTVAILVIADVFRTRDEELHGHADGSAHDARPGGGGTVRASRQEASPREPARMAVPAGYGAALNQQSQNIGLPARSSQPSRPGLAAAGKRSRRALGDWKVGSRLLLLGSVPAAAGAAAALCCAGVAGIMNGAAIHASNSSVRDKAVLSAIGLGLVAILVLALALRTAVVTARSMLRPLRRLRAGALELAARMPEPVRRASQGNGDGAASDLEPVAVGSSDEIGDIARVFDQMRREMVRLAADDAALRRNLNAVFVNLSHRSRSLLERQIRLIEKLQSGEQDAGRLADLVKMDHIAGRMHRNSQNLLVLAGHEVSGHWTQPAALADVVRAAVSEVEEYERVTLNVQPGIAVSASAFNDVVHLLAELTENATSFSAADMPVDIVGELLASGGAMISITDRGVGMGQKELAYANWQMENPPTSEISVSRWMGLLVVGRLAARHGIRVRLQSAEFGGLTAMVWLPDEVLTFPGPGTSPGFASPRLGGLSGGSRPGSPEMADPGRDAAAHMAIIAGRTESGVARAVPRDQPHASGMGRRPGPGWRSAPGAELPAFADPSRSDDAASAVGETFAAIPRPEPGSPAPGGDEMSRPSGPPAGAVLPPGQETSPAAGGVTVPPAENPAEARGLPIYDSVKSVWFRSGRISPLSPGSAGAPESRWSSPADQGWRAAQTVSSPSSGGPTAAGLPKRLPNANLVPGTVPGTQPAAVPNWSPAEARERLAGLQRGLSEGRAAIRQAQDPAIRQAQDPAIRQAQDPAHDEES